MIEIYLFSNLCRKDLILVVLISPINAQFLNKYVQKR